MPKVTQNNAKAQYMRQYRKRKRDEVIKIRSTPKTSSERTRNFYMKQKHAPISTSAERSEPCPKTTGDEDLGCAPHENLTHMPVEVVKIEDNTDMNEDDHQVYRHTCNECQEEIRSVQYSCLQCMDYDLCCKCESRGVHNAHYMLRIPSARPHDEIEELIVLLKIHVLNFFKKRSNRTDNGSCVVMEALEIKQDPLPYLYPAEDTDMTVADPLLLSSEVSDTQTVPKRKQVTGEDNTEIQPKPTRTSIVASNESIIATTKIDIVEESIDTEDNSPFAVSQGVAA